MLELGKGQAAGGQDAAGAIIDTSEATFMQDVVEASKTQLVDGFQGAIPPSELKKFIDDLIAKAPAGDDDGLEEAIAAAEEMLEAGAAADAAATFAAILEEDAACLPAIAGLARAYLSMNELPQARATLEMTPKGKESCSKPSGATATGTRAPPRRSC